MNTSPTQPLQNLILSASAGTGKTFTLTTHFIRLLAQKDPQGAFVVHPKEILALTFSKAAAFEIYTKLVTRLAKAASTECEAQKTNQTLNPFNDTFLRPALKPTQPYTLTQADYTLLLRRVIGAQHINNIATIDSFILRMVQYLPLELGLLGGITLLEDYDQARLLEEALETALADKTLRAALKSFNTFSDLRTSKARLERMMAIQNDIRENPALKDREEITLSDIATLLEVPLSLLTDKTPPNALATLLHATPDALDRANDPQTLGLLRIALRFAQWTPTSKTKPTDLPTYINPTGTHPQDHAKTLLKLYYEDPQPHDTYLYRKKSYRLSPEAEAALLQDITTIHARTIAHAIQTQFHIFKIVQAIDATYDKAVRARGNLRFDDLPWFFYNVNFDLHRIENIEYHFDGRFRHWAVDEFQDTSHAQWACLKTFIESTADKTAQDNAHSVTIVGDTKQAIYAFRGGDDRILRSLLNDTSERFDKFPLRTSYRYQKHTCDFLNRLFGKENMTRAQGNLINASLPSALKPTLSTTPLIDGWLSKASWMEHLPYDDRANDYVKVIRFKKPKKETSKSEESDAASAEEDLARQCLGQEIKDLWHRRGNSTETFGVLVRDNTEANAIAEALRRIGLPASSESESPIANLPTLAPLLALLKLIEHPDDTLAWETVYRTPLLPCLLGEIPARPALLEAITSDYARLGLARLVAKWTQALLRNTLAPLDPISKERLIAVASAAETFERTSRPEATLEAFFEYLEAQTQRAVVSDPTQIRVITIHRSKGLGFNHVFLPTKKSRLGLTTLDPLKAKPFYATTHNIPWTAKLNSACVTSFPALAKIYEAAIDQQILDELHTFYVAMTRSMDSLTVFYDEPSEDTPRFNSLLDAMMIDSPARPINDLAEIRYEAGEPPPALPRDTSNRPADAPKTAPLPTVPATLNLPAPIASEQPSKQQEERLMSDFFADHHGHAAQRGIDLHTQLQAIEWLTPEASASALERNLLDSPLAEAFLRPKADCTLWREYRYDRIINNTWQTGQFDRVIIFNTPDHPHAIIYDYKTNRNWEKKPLEAFAKEMADTYRHQMQRYREALSDLLNLPKTAIETKLLLLDTHQVVPV